MPRKPPKPLTPNQEIARDLIKTIPPELLAGERIGSTAIGGLAIHLQYLGIPCQAFKSMASCGWFQTGCSYLIVDGLKMDAFGHRGDAKVARRAIEATSQKPGRCRIPEDMYDLSGPGPGVTAAQWQEIQLAGAHFQAAELARTPSVQTQASSRPRSRL